MTKSKKRALASKPVASESTTTPEPTTPSPAKQDQGFFLNVANWLLSRLPWFRDRYETWGKGKRVFIGLLMYLIVLPVIPIVIGIVMYVRDPEGFRRSKAFPILGVVIAAWLGAFGLIAAQPSKQTQTNSTTINGSQTTTAGQATTGKSAKDTSDTVNSGQASTAKKDVQTRDKSEATLGRQFKNCDAAFTAGVFNIPKTDASYADHLDGDNDGVACEK